MYQVLLVTDQQDVREAFDSFPDWRLLGFELPRIVCTAKEATLLVESGAADAVAYVLPKDEGQSFFSFLTHYPQIRCMEAASDPLRLRRALGSLRRALHEQSADGTLTDVLPILQAEFFHSLLEDAPGPLEALRARAAALQIQLALDAPVCLARLQLPQGEVYLAEVWRYGRERLELALRNFFERDESGLRYVLCVLNPREIKLLACPKAAIDGEALRHRVNERLAQGCAETLEYLELEVKIKSVTLYENLGAMGGTA
ncbi:MAG: hypothetical protein FWD25_02130 [Clostridia bacterium]|nr:hypothetical protein [Clostridia bacterium]